MVWPIGSCSTDAWRKIKRATRLNGGKQKCLADGRCADHESDARPPRPSSHLSPCPPHTPAHHHTPFHHALRPMGLGCQQRSHLLYTGPCIVPPRDTPHSCQPLLCAKHLIAYIIALSGACRRGSSPLRSPFATLLSSGRLHAQRRWHSNSHPYHSYTQTRHRRNSFRVAQLYV